MGVPRKSDNRTPSLWSLPDLPGYVQSANRGSLRSRAAAREQRLHQIPTLNPIEALTLNTLELKFLFVL